MPFAWSAETVTRLRAPLVNDQGTRVRDWSDESKLDQLPIAGCSVSPFSAIENTAGGDTETTTYEVHAPTNADVVDTDRIRWNGADYEVDGMPALWSTPTRSRSHLSFRIVRQVG